MSIYLGDTPLANTGYDKADVDLSNVNASGTSLASGWSMPSSRYIDLTLGASGTEYTAPANGFFQFAWLGAGSSCQMYNKSSNYFWTTNEGETQSCWLPVKKSDVALVYYVFGTGASLRWFRFYYAEGEV